MRVCERCTSENADTARFCHACGVALADAGRILEERKLVSILFVDMVGSTARADDADPEDVRDELRAFHDCVRKQIEHFDGTVEKFIGDAVVAVFGAPLAHGDDAERAVRCGLRVIEAIDGLNAERPELSFAVRAAVNTGEAVVALGSAFERGEALATGDVVNTAARLQTAARPGGLVVGAQTYEATRRAIAYEALPAVDAKGKRDPVTAWLAVGPISSVDTPERKRPIVGRERELDLLRTLWERVVQERRPHLVTVLGPAGIGKSRLSDEFLAHVATAGGRSLAGRCLPYEERTGYRASAEQVKTFAEILETDAPQVAREKLERAVSDLVAAGESDDVARYLSLLLGLGVDEPTDDRLQLFFAVRRVVEAIGAEPSVILFEDLHWAGTSQLDLLEYLLTHVRDVPVVFLALARPELIEARPTWGGQLLPQTTIPLEPLSDADARVIVASLLGDGEQTSVPVERLVETAGGNPLFVEELAASVRDRHADAGGLPTTVREAIASRIDVLPPEQRTVLLDASVIGRTFWRGVLGAIGETALGLDGALDALEARDLIRRGVRSQMAGDREFTFKHVLIRDAAYAMIPRGVKRDRHAAVAGHVEATAADNLRDLAWILAHHWREAGERDRAVDYLVLAAERAREAWAKEEANHLYDDALALIGDTDPARATGIRLRRAVMNVNLGDIDEGAAEMRELLPQLEGREEIEALIELARCSVWQERVEDAYRQSDRARELAERIGDPELLPAAIGFQGAARIGGGEIEEATALCDAALRTWVPGARPFDLAQVTEWQSENRYWIGDYAIAEELARTAHEMGGKNYSIDRQLRGGGWHGLTLAAMGRTEEAIVMLDAIVDRMREVGEPRWGAASLNYSSLPFRDLFMFDEARRRNESSLELVSKHGAWGMPELQGKIDLLLTDLLQGDVGRAQREWPVLWDAAINGTAWRPWLGGMRLALVRAAIARETEGSEATIQWAHEARDRASSGYRPKYEADAMELLGEALVGLRRAEEGLAELRGAVAIADRLGSPSARWRIRATLGLACDATGDDDGAAAAFSQAAEVIVAYADTLTGEHAASFLVAEPVHAVLQRSGRV